MCFMWLLYHGLGSFASYRQLLLETSSKDLVAYLDKKNDIVIEKFVL